MSTQSVLAHHLQAIPEGVDAVMTDYTEHSVLFTPDGPLKGLEAIRGFYEAFIANSPPGLIEALALTRQDIDGDIAYIVWKAEPFIPFATDTFVVRNGTIAAQTFAMPRSPLS